MFYFLVGCFLCDLIPNKDVITSLNQLCLEIPNGLVCYNGYLPGAVAVYVCNKDYILHGDSTRECDQDGLWSGQVPQCQFYLNSTNTPTILGTYTLPLVMPLGCEWFPGSLPSACICIFFNAMCCVLQCPDQNLFVVVIFTLYTTQVLRVEIVMIYQFQQLPLYSSPLPLPCVSLAV